MHLLKNRVFPLFELELVKYAYELTSHLKYKTYLACRVPDDLLVDSCVRNYNDRILLRILPLLDNPCLRKYLQSLP